MTIPQHLIEKAARSTYEKSPWLDGYEIVPWQHVPERLRSASMEDARHALEAVAADIWDEGFIRGSLASEIDADLHETREIDLNPHERIEHA